MPGRTRSVFVVCTAVLFASAHLSRAQEATSANLPDQFQTGEMIQIQKPKKKRTESISKTVATAPTQDPALVPEQTPAEQLASQIAPTEEKKIESNRSSVSMPPNEKPATPIEQLPVAEESSVVAVPAEKKLRTRKRSRPVVQPEPTIISAPVAMSLSVARSMAITAPMPEYPYEAKRRNLTGSGICVVTVETATGTVTDAAMFQSTGSPLLDKLTIQTFKGWRFKPGTVSQLRVPISYE